MNNKLKKLISIMLLIVLVIVFAVYAFGVTVAFPSAQYVNEYKEFYFYKKDVVIDPLLDVGINGSFSAVKIWFLPGQKNKLLKRIQEDVNTELLRITEENNDTIKDFEISDDFKKIYIYCHKDSMSSSHFDSLCEALTVEIEYRVELYFQILNGYGNTDYDGYILNYVE